MELKAQFIFEGKAVNLLTDEIKNYLITEFVERRDDFTKKVNSMYEKWNKEFDDTYPDKDGCSEEYLDFIWNKHSKPLMESNSKDIYLNQVKLVSDVNNGCDIYGYVEKLDLRIYLTLV